MRGAGLYPHGKGGAHTFHAVGDDRTAMKSYEFLDEGQADARALMRARRCAVNPMKPVEDFRQLTGGDAGTGVVHAQLYAVAVPPQRDTDAALEGELEGIAQEVEDDLLPHLAIDEDRFGQQRAVDVEVQTGLLDRGPEHAGDLRGGAGEVRRLVVRLHAAS